MDLWQMSSGLECECGQSHTLQGSNMGEVSNTVLVEFRLLVSLLKEQLPWNLK